MCVHGHGGQGGMRGWRKSCRAFQVEDEMKESRVGGLRRVLYAKSLYSLTL